IHLDDEHVRLELVRLRDRLFTVGSDGDDLHVRFLLDDLPDSHCRDPTRVGQKDPDRALGPLAHSCSLVRSVRRARSGSTFFSTGRSSVTAVPLPGVDWICNVPPISSARSRIERSPTDFLWRAAFTRSNPMPSSVTCSTQLSFARDHAIP